MCLKIAYSLIVIISYLLKILSVYVHFLLSLLNCKLYVCKMSVYDCMWLYLTVLLYLLGLFLVPCNEQALNIISE